MKKLKKEEIRKASEESQLYMQCGKELYSKRNYRDALEYFSRAILKTPRNCFVYNMAGLTCFKLKEYHESLQYFSKGITLGRKQNVRKTKISSIYGNRSLPSMELGNFSDAMNDCKAALEYNSDNKFALINLADISYEMRDYVMSVEYATRAIECGGEGFLLPFKFRGLSAVRIGDYKIALEDLKKAIEMEKEKKIPSSKKKSKESSSRDDKSTINQSKKMKSLYYEHMGISHDRLGNFQQAIRYFTNAKRFCVLEDEVEDCGVIDFRSLLLVLRRGVSAFNLGEYSTATSDFESVRKTLETLNSKRLKFHTHVVSQEHDLMKMLIDLLALSWIGIVHYHMKDFDRSHSILTEVISTLAGLNVIPPRLKKKKQPVARYVWYFVRNFYETFKYRGIINYSIGNNDQAMQDFHAAEAIISIDIATPLTTEDLHSRKTDGVLPLPTEEEKPEEEEQEEEEEEVKKDGDDLAALEGENDKSSEKTEEEKGQASNSADAATPKKEEEEEQKETESPEARKERKTKEQAENTFVNLLRKHILEIDFCAPLKEYFFEYDLNLGGDGYEKKKKKGKKKVEDDVIRSKRTKKKCPDNSWNHGVSMTRKN